MKKNKKILIGNEESLNDLNIEEFEIKYKKEHPEIFEEFNKEYEKIGNNIETVSINFIKKILNKFPPKDYDKSIDVEKEFKNNPNKLMKELNKIYKSNNETEEEKKMYTIIKEMEILITSLYNRIN